MKKSSITVGKGESYPLWNVSSGTIARSPGSIISANAMRAHPRVRDLLGVSRTYLVSPRFGVPMRSSMSEVNLRTVTVSLDGSKHSLIAFVNGAMLVPPSNTQAGSVEMFSISVASKSLPASAYDYMGGACHCSSVKLASPRIESKERGAFSTLLQSHYSY